MRIYYFSGTGNSLHVAKELESRLPGTELAPIARHLDEDRPAAESEAVGFVFPIHLTSMPYPVKDFIERLNLDSADYLFAAATRIGTYHVADLVLRRMLKKKGIDLDAFFILHMAANSPCGIVPKSFPGFKKMVDGWPGRIAPEKVAELEEGVQERLRFIAETVRERRRYLDPRSPLGAIGARAGLLLNSLTEKSNRKTRIPFYADEGCAGCGTCADVCLSGRVRMDAGKPLWSGEEPCFLCYACFNACPEQAVLIRNRYERKGVRYLHSCITAEDIAGQKLPNPGHHGEGDAGE